MFLKSFILLKINRLTDNPVLIAILFHVSLCLLFLTIYFSVISVEAFNIENMLMKWDGLWYLDIKNKGYTYIEGQQNSTAFFPLFPSVWALSGFNTLYISIFNGLIFSVSYFFLARHLKFDFLQTLFWLSTPLFFFCYIPYSESFFFAGCVLILIGLNKNQTKLIIVGIIITSLTRSVGVILIPAILATFVFNQNKNILLFWKTALYIVIILLSSLLVFLVQFYQTGYWFVFFETQKSWKRELQFPTLPFVSQSGYIVLFLDILSLTGVFAAILYFLRFSFLRFKYISNLPSSVIFSVSYLVGIGLISIFFSGVWNEGSGTLLMSLSRFFFVPPFFILTMTFVRNNRLTFRNNILIFLVLILLCFLLYGGYNNFNNYFSNVQTFTLLICLMTYIGLYNFQNTKIILIVLYVINLTIQLSMLNRFLLGEWVA